MKKFISSLVMCTCAAIMTACGPAAKEHLTIDLANRGASVSPDMYGVFFEEINHAGDGGLYAELVENRSFEELDLPDEGYHVEGDRLITPSIWNPERNAYVTLDYRWTTDPVPGWTLDGEASMKLSKKDPMFASAPTSLEVSVNKDKAVLTNDGYWGMNLKEGISCTLRTIIKAAPGFAGNITARLVDADGRELASSPLEVKSKWNDTSVIITPSDATDKGKLQIVIEGKGVVSLDYVSLMPSDTFDDGKLPLRADVADMIAGLNPAFIRWPGGCVVEGITLSNRFEWKKTLGDPAARSGEYSTWGYRCSYGFGYYEMLRFCEIIGAKAMYVCNVGFGCQARTGDTCPEEDVEYYLDDCMDALEYALGPEDSEWGKVRAANGHPKPFPLAYVEIGNENLGDAYDRRFDLFYKTIKEKYPELTLICNRRFGTSSNIEKTDMLDSHWYVAPSYFFHNTHIFDNVERGKYTYYVGEYAVNSNVGRGCLRGALAEAAFMEGMERNGDLVKMASYAPLFENSNDAVWPVNLIWINSSQVMGRSSYYVQKMAAENIPTYNVHCSTNEGAVNYVGYNGGKLALGTYKTATQFKDMKIETPDGKVTNINLENVSEKYGDWSYNDGILSQTNIDGSTRYVLEDFKGDEYVMTMKINRTGGYEGFYIQFGLDDNAQNGLCYNVGGWGNYITAVELITDGRNDGNRYAEAVGKGIRTDGWQDVRLEMTKEGSKLYLDGELILEHKPMEMYNTFYEAGYDEKYGETVIKVVNSLGTDYTVDIDLSGAASVAKEGTVITLSSENDTDENSFEEPYKIIPVETAYSHFGKKFKYTFKPYSYTILRIPTVI